MTRHNRPKKREAPHRNSDEEKGSPNSLRRLFNAIRQTADNGSPLAHPEFRESLDSAWRAAGKDGKGRYGQDGVGPVFWRATEDGAKGKKIVLLPYWVIEAYAHLLSEPECPMPAGVLLIISRLTAHMRHANDPAESKYSSSDDPDRIMAGMISVFEAFKKDVSGKPMITDEDLRGLIDAYLGKSKNELSS